MLAAFVKSWWGYLLLVPQVIRAIPGGSTTSTLKRAVLLPLGWAAFGLLNAIHWLGFLFDEILFPGYRKVRIAAPIEIVGVPRSGTTFLQRALATEPKFTTLTLFECVLAPSITERYVWFGFGRLCSRIFGRLVSAGRFRVDRMEAIHPIGLDEPEEDFILLLWVHACFLAVVPLPAEDRYWRLARFDQLEPGRSRQIVFDFYERCLQRHLYYHGEDRRLLSKNPSFTPMLRSLRDRFPDATMVGCVRAPVKTVPSQLSSLLPAFEMLGNGEIPRPFQRRMINALLHYYAELAQFASEDDIKIVEMERLNSELESVVAEIFDHAAHQPSETFQAKLAALGSGGRNYQSAHRYSLADFNLTEAEIGRSFSGVWPLSLAPVAVRDV